MTEQKPHLLKNGHPAHVFTDEDRRKAAAVTNEIRREKRLLLEQLRMNREIEEVHRPAVGARTGDRAPGRCPARGRHPV